MSLEGSKDVDGNEGTEGRIRDRFLFICSFCTLLMPWRVWWDITKLSPIYLLMPVC